jgi:hypothetical protein
MATKAILMKLIEESRGYEQITNRRPIPRPIFLYLMQLRASAAHAQPVKQRLTIRTDWSDDTNAPLPVKINHIMPGECELPIVFG